MSEKEQLLKQYDRLRKQLPYLKWTIENDCQRVNRTWYAHEHTSREECAESLIAAGMNWQAICMMHS